MNEREQEPKFDAAAVRSAKSMALGDSEATPVYIAAKITAEYAPLVEAAREMLGTCPVCGGDGVEIMWGDPYNERICCRCGAWRAAFKKVVSDE